MRAQIAVKMNSPCHFYICRPLDFHHMAQNISTNIYFYRVNLETNVIKSNAVLVQCSISIPSENVKKSLVFWRFGGINIEHWAKMG